MKIIDLLNKIANGEEVRFKIDENPYHCYRYSNLYDEVEKEEVKWYLSEDWLNEEVEVIEEDKKIEKIKVKSNFTHNQKKIVRKINEIIEEIEKIKDDRK